MRGALSILYGRNGLPLKETKVYDDVYLDKALQSNLIMAFSGKSNLQIDGLHVHEFLIAADGMKFIGVESAAPGRPTRYQEWWFRPRANQTEGKGK